MSADSTQPSRDSFLDMFDVPVRKALEKSTKEIGHDSDRLLPLVLASVDQAKKAITQGSKYRSLPLPVVKVQLQEEAWVRVMAALRQGAKIRAASGAVRSWSSVFVVGAGLSFESGIPLRDVLTQLLAFCEAADYRELRNDLRKCSQFKKEFARMCAAKQPGVSHELIARNCGRSIREVICMNWDNLIEEAARKLDKAIPKVNEEKDVTAGSHIWKFHGDVENIADSNVKGKGGWVFPDEEGHVFDCFLRYLDMTKLAGQMFTLVIVGYSEEEKEVYEKVVVPLEKTPPRPTFRVGLNLERLHDEGYLVGPADYVLEQILSVV